MKKKLQLVLTLLKEGWPNEKKKVPNEIRVYHTVADELFEKDGLLFKNDKLIVPKALRKEMINRLHYGHLGIEKTKNKARELLYWPGMSKEIEDAVQNCSTCLEFRKSNIKEPLIQHEIPNAPWIKLGTDLINFKGKDYLLIIDYFSKYVDIGYLPNISSESVINVLKASFAKHGIPKLLYTDPGTQFTSVKFKDFIKKWDFEHKTSSAKHSQSNGMVERHIQTVKRSLKKAEQDNRDPYIVLLEYRNTPITPEIGSPNQLMFGRNVNGFVPTCNANYKRKTNIDYDKIREKLRERQESQKLYYDQHVKRLPDFDVGDQVRIQNAQNKLFDRKGVIISKPDKPRSYNVLTESLKNSE